MCPYIGIREERRFKSNIISTLVANKEQSNNNVIWGNYSIDDLKQIIFQRLIKRQLNGEKIYSCFHLGKEGKIILHIHPIIT